MSNIVSLVAATPLIGALVSIAVSLILYWVGAYKTSAIDYPIGWGLLYVSGFVVALWGSIAFAFVVGTSAFMVADMFSGVCALAAALLLSATLLLSALLSVSCGYHGYLIERKIWVVYVAVAYVFLMLLTAL